MPYSSSILTYKYVTFLYLDEESKSTTSESKPSDSTPTTTVDKKTDSRHESSAALEGEKPTTDSSEGHSVSKEIPKEISDNNPTNSPEKKEEFAVPITPSLHRRKNRKPQKVFVASPDNNETVNVEKTEMSDQSADNDSQSGRKRIGSDGVTDVQIEQNKETEENVSYDF